MSIRDQLNRRPILTAIIGSIALVVALVLILPRPSGGAASKVNVYYTTDEGATLFADDSEKVPPFDHDGKPAVEARVYTCDGRKHQFVQCLVKVADTGQRVAGLPAGVTVSRVVKRPGAKDWVDMASPRAASIFIPVCPDGQGTGPIEQVLP
jgi:hypothetical protein